MFYLMDDYNKKSYSVYHYSFRELQEEFIKFKNMSDAQFRKNSGKILHFAIFVCYLKEIPTEYCLNDKGIVHEMLHVHLKISGNTLRSIREEFNRMLDLGSGPFRVKKAKKKLLKKGRSK